MPACPKLIKYLFSFLIALAIFLFLPNKVLAVNLLTNPGFEEGIDSWSFTPQTATFSATQSPAHGGNYAALLTKIDSSSWAYFSQKVNIEVDRYYKLSGWVMLNDSFINNIKLRFYWLDSSETKISQTPVGVETTTHASDFQFLETESALSPANVFYAEVQGYVYLETKNPVNPAIFDDLVFEEVAEPGPTPEPTALPTSTPTPTSTSTPTPKPPTPTPTKKPTPTPTPSPIPTPTGEILAEEATPSTEEPLPTPEVLGETSRSPLNLLPKVLIGAGIFLLVVSGAFLLFPKIRGYNKESLPENGEKGKQLEKPE